MQKFVQPDSWMWYKYLIDVKLARCSVWGIWFYVRDNVSTNQIAATVLVVSDVDSKWFKLRENIPTRLSNENKAVQVCVWCHHELFFCGQGQVSHF